jgi:hypothetical protein
MKLRRMVFLIMLKKFGITLFTLSVVFLLLCVNVQAEDIIIPQLVLDRNSCAIGENVQLDLILNATNLESKTNSVLFQVDFDSTAFDLVSTDENYIPFVQSSVVNSSESIKTVKLLYVNMSEDLFLQNNNNVCRMNFRVKDTATLGDKTFTLRPVALLDSTETIYNVNNNNPVSTTVSIVNSTTIEGYLSIYIGPLDTGLRTLVYDNVNQSILDETLRNLRFTLKHNASDSGTVISGEDIFVFNGNGGLALKNNGNIIAKFVIPTADIDNTILTIDGCGFLKKDFTVSINLLEPCVLGTQENPIEICPGDVGSIINSKLELIPDNIIDNVDFSAWLKIYENNDNLLASSYDILRADFTKDGVIDNVDFSLWLASYKKQ